MIQRSYISRHDPSLQAAQGISFVNATSENAIRIGLHGPSNSPSVTSHSTYWPALLCFYSTVGQKRFSSCSRCLSAFPWLATFIHRIASTTAQGAYQAFSIDSRINSASVWKIHPSARMAARRRRAIYGDVVICLTVATLCNHGTWSLPPTMTALVMPNKSVFDSFVRLLGSRKSDRDWYVLEWRRSVMLLLQLIPRTSAGRLKDLRTDPLSLSSICIVLDFSKPCKMLMVPIWILSMETL